MLMLLTVITNYPQAMLKSECLNEDNMSVESVDKIYKSKNNYLDINVIVPQIKGLSNDKKEAEINDKITKWTEKWIDEVKSIADEYFKDYPSPLISYQLYVRYKVTNNSDIISFYIDYYQFTGGAHGITNRVAYNIDSVTGNELQLKDIFKKKFENPYRRIGFISILLVVGLMLFKGRYSGLGTNLIDLSFQQGTIQNYDWLLKLVFTIITLAIGFQGGEVTPLFSIGASFGIVLAFIFHLPIELCAALGYVAVFASATNTLLAPIMMAIEVFGGSNMMIFVIVCIFAYLVNGNHSIYGAQINHFD